ncbi:DUF4311 domain-containing protein [Helcococcus sueciensis]|uniref:DUF4311 domain-containing protein n=1 Tax=Helcococcus sueciensis TaxID=241555 RepID=UPI00041CDCE0|nr:DUF4311 domain-containing protein [Helcococcus sueciensis]
MEIILKSIIVGFLMGAAISAGASRMFRAPQVQGMGAFRTLGELNASNGDPVSHFSFGLGFFITSAASAIGTGSLTQDVLHRVIPNWAAALVGLKKDKDYKTATTEMFIVGGIIGALVLLFLNTTASLIPVDLATMAKDILTPAATNMINYVMPLLFLWAAMDAGQTIGIWAIIFGGIMAIISGNSLPGIIFGILCGSLVEEKGKKDKSTISMFIIVIVMILLIAYFRDFHVKLFDLFK